MIGKGDDPLKCSVLKHNPLREIKRRRTLRHIHAVFILLLLLFLFPLLLPLVFIFVFVFVTNTRLVVNKRIPPFFCYDFAILAYEIYKYVHKYTRYVTYRRFVSLGPYFIGHLRLST
jgi:hypothetical protein